MIGDEDWLFPTGDARALAERLAERLEDPAGAEPDGALIERVRNEFSWDRIAERTLELFEEAARGTPR